MDDTIEDRHDEGHDGAQRQHRRGRRLLPVLAGALTLAGSAVVGAAPAQAAPTFQLPVPCGQVWSGQTRSTHSPANAIDFNRADDVDDAVVAAAGGTVTTVRDLGGESYGRYVVVDHGSGWTTYYAHLNAFSVTAGQRVSAGTRIGLVGSTGGSTGPHLHFEERYGGSAQRLTFNGSSALYWGTQSYTSANCSSTGYPGTVNTAGSPLTVRSGPGTSYAAVGSLADGTEVSISCQTTGSTVTGTYGTSNIWDRIGSGRYVSDAYVFTGDDGMVAPAC